MILGFNTYTPNNILWRDKINLSKKCGCQAVELSYNSLDRTDWLDKLTLEDFIDFDFISLHAPTRFLYKNNKETNKLLVKLQNLHKKFNFNIIVLHSDIILDWDVFKKYDLPIAIENMDNRKESGKTVEDLKEIFERNDIKMVLDINHCYVNDNSLKLVKEMYDNFKDRIVEIHLSGFEAFHDLLYKTKQIEFIKSLPNKNIPVIIESMIDSIVDIKKEFDYIKKNLNN